MDSREYQEIIRKKERRYIWLEKELRRNIMESAAILLALFLLVLYLDRAGRITIMQAGVVFGGAFIYFAWRSYRRYAGNYRGFQQIQNYLEEYEAGNYLYRSDADLMKEGIRSQIQEQLERMGFAMELMKDRMMEEKENTKTLVTDISHQLKTPLSALKLSYELAEDEQFSTEEKVEFLTRGDREIDKLQTLMEALTNLSRMEADMIQIRPVPGKIRETLAAAVGSVYMKAYQKRIEIEVLETKEQKSGMEIVYDPKWTGEAIINILDNAVKYSKEGTVIEVRIIEQLSYITIEIEDQGIGIPKAEYANIFKRFYRVSRQEVQKESGSGVGLYLARRILEEQGGSIKVQPGQRGGTVFALTLQKSFYTL